MVQLFDADLLAKIDTPAVLQLGDILRNLMTSGFKSWQVFHDACDQLAREVERRRIAEFDTTQIVGTNFIYEEQPYGYVKFRVESCTPAVIPYYGGPYKDTGWPGMRIEGRVVASSRTGALWGGVPVPGTTRQDPPVGQPYNLLVTADQLIVGRKVDVAM